MKVEMNLPDLPNGYEYTGEYRNVTEGEYFLPHLTKKVKLWDDTGYSMAQYCIIREKRWRAEKGETYYALTTDYIVFECTDVRSDLDNDFYQAGNYFQSEKQAEEASIKIKQLLKELHNNGSK